MCEQQEEGRCAGVETPTPCPEKREYVCRGTVCPGSYKNHKTGLLFRQRAVHRTQEQLSSGSEIQAVHAGPTVGGRQKKGGAGG